MQPCNRIYYSNVYWRLNMFRAAHRCLSHLPLRSHCKNQHHALTSLLSRELLNWNLQLQSDRKWKSLSCVGEKRKYGFSYFDFCQNWSIVSGLQEIRLLWKSSGNNWNPSCLKFFRLVSQFRTPNVPCGICLLPP